MTRSLPNFFIFFIFYFPEGFCLSHNMEHWSNETETIRLINDVLVSYINKMKEGKSLPHNKRKYFNMGSFQNATNNKSD